MLRFWWAVAASTVLAAGVAPRPARAQQWNDSTTRALVVRAVERREQQLADTGLVDYRAEAHGYVTFLAQVGQGYTELPRILKADQLALEVYWKAPNLSKQRILGRRDTLLLPTDIQYHRDHLGIVQNNFPDIIRLGEGDEVRDVPHPLSRAGLAEYDYALGDSLRISIPGRAIDVYEVRVRPKNDRGARVLGAVYLDRASAQVVRMAFSFTRAAFLDRALEDLSVVLENRLVGSRFWLPSRQEIEIRRSGTWMDSPVRGIIRGRWEISGYQFNVGLPPARFAGPEIVMAPPEEMRAYAWEGQLLDSIPPDVRAVTPAEVARVQAEARNLVRAQALQRRQGSALAFRNVSDFVRVNRVEGLALGAGATQRLGDGFDASFRVRFGFADHAPKGELSLGWQRADGAGARVYTQHDLRDAGDASEVSRIRNTLAAQEFGSDFTDPVEVHAVGLGLALGRHFGVLWSARGALESLRMARVHASPADGRFEGTLRIPDMDATRLALGVERPTALLPFGVEGAAEAELRLNHRWRRTEGTIAGERPAANVWRFHASASLERPFGPRRLVSATSFTAADASALAMPQELAFAGGPVSAPGYDYHAFAGRLIVTQHLEWRMPVPFLRVPLGRFGTAPATATLAPYIHAAGIAAPVAVQRAGGTATASPIQPAVTSGIYPSVGIGVLTLFDLFRIDVARGLRGGRWSFSVDLAPEFWRIL
ncbi:MAG: hypothetical protein ACYC3Q_03395 [Gemmatimonadaceae bacterium]